MNRLVRAIAHALERLAAVLLGLAGNEDVASWERPVRADRSPPPDWLRRMRRDPPRDWLERVRRGRPRWMGGSTPAPPSVVFPPPPVEATIFPPTTEEGRVGAAPPTDPPRQGERERFGRVRGEIAEAETPHPGPPPQGGREIDPRGRRARSGRAGGEIAEAETSHPGPPPQGGREIKPQGGRERFGRIGGEVAKAETPHPGPPPKGGREINPPGPRGRSGSLVGKMAETLTWPPIEAPWESGATVTRRGGSEQLVDGRPSMSVVRLATAGDLPRQAVYEIEELPFEAGTDNPWPDLPGADPPADAGDPITLWRGWERRERLAREQRGD